MYTVKKKSPKKPSLKLRGRKRVYLEKRERKKKIAW